MSKFNLLRTRRFAAAGTRQAASGAFETRFATPFAAAGAASPRPGRGDVVATACARLWRRRPSDDRRRTTFSKPTDALSNARARARAWGFRDLEQTSGPRAAASSWRGCARGTPSSKPAKGNCGCRGVHRPRGTGRGGAGAPESSRRHGQRGGASWRQPRYPTPAWSRPRLNAPVDVRAMRFGIWKCQNMFQISFHFLLARE